MSELNNKKKNSFLFVIVYLILAIIITVTAIIFYKINGIGIVEYFSKDKENVKNNVENEKTNTIISQDDNIKRISLTDKYKLNNLKIEEIEYYEGEEYYSAGYGRKKLSVNYPKISGLKDKTIEENINKEIEDKTKNLLSQEEMNDNEIAFINLNAYVMGNFNDVISIYIDKYIDYVDNEKEDYMATISLNYRLDNGEKISFEDLFTKDASVKSILSQTAYNTISMETSIDYETNFYSEQNDEEIYDPSKVDYSNVEDKVFKILNEYNQTDEKNFYFSNYYIYLSTEYAQIEIPMVDYYNYINIYNLVPQGESLYEKGDTKSEIYVFGEDYSKTFEYDGKISDYIYLTIFNYDKLTLTSMEENEEIPEDLNEFATKNSKIYQDNLDDLKDLIIKTEKGNSAFYNINSFFYDENDRLTFNCQKVNLDKENFEENVKEVYATGARNRGEGEQNFSLKDIDDCEYFYIVNKNGKFEIEKYDN